VGAAWGARSRERFRRAVRLTSELAIGTALVLSLMILFFGQAAVSGLTTLPGVREAAFSVLPWAALYVLVSVAAFQLDGVFIGTTRTREMRNAGVISLAVFLLAAWPLAGTWGNHGLWVAFIIYVIARAGALWPYFRRMEAGLARPCARPASAVAATLGGMLGKRVAWDGRDAAGRAVPAAARRGRHLVLEGDVRGGPRRAGGDV